MAVTNAQIREMLNRPRGLNEQTITEYSTIRTAQVNKIVRSSDLYGISTDNQITDALKESAIKFAVCVDCLTVLIDTVPSYYPQNEQGTNDQRFRDQLKRFQAQSDEMMAIIKDKGLATFHIKALKTKQEADPTIATTETRTLGLSG
tara:strand:- start:1757 stop:2197 length:441 start_codon:yes stop_codon:yes gene_type:complete